MTEFKYKSRKEQKAMSMEELGLYKRGQRKYEFEQGIPMKGIKRRRLLHPLIDLILKANRIGNHQKLTVLKNGSKPKSLRDLFTPTIYAFTHIGGSDVESMVEAADRHAYLFFGDPEPMYKDKEVNLLVFLNGSIDFNTKDKDDRKISFFRGKELLSRRGRLIIFVEGAWNVFEHLPVMKIFPGASKMAIEVDKEKRFNVDIVPGAIEQYGDEFVVSFGNRIKTNKHMDPKELDKRIRDELATLKYEIFETQPPLEVTPTTNAMVWENVTVSEELALQKEYDEIYRQGIIDRRSGYSTLEDIYRDMYKDPNETTAHELIGETQNKLDTIKKISFLRQEVDELISKIRALIEKLQTQNPSVENKKRSRVEISISARLIAAEIAITGRLIEEKIAKIRQMIEFLDDREKQPDEDYDFDNTTVQRYTELQNRIDNLNQIKNTLLSLGMPSEFNIDSSIQNSEKRISLN